MYGAGQNTIIANIESKLAKVLNKKENFLIINSTDRNKVMDEIAARAARYEKFDPDMTRELKALRQDVKDAFNKGQPVGDDIMEQLYFLDPKTRDLVEKLSRSYGTTVTPEDFKQIANIMTESLERQAPILRSYNKFMGRLAADYVTNAKPKDSSIDFDSALKTAIYGEYKAGTRLPKWLSRIMGIKDEGLKEKMLRRIPGYVPDSILTDLAVGVKAPETRRTGFKIGKFSVFSEDITKGVEIGYANKLPKSWTHLPAVNFDGKVLEQEFSLSYEEKLLYKDKDGKWITNFIQVSQKTEPNLWEVIRNKDGKFNAIGDISKAQTAYGVNSNHANDAVLVKQFHLWGRKAKVQTGTVHDAFFTNSADMLEARQALREIYAGTLKSESIKWTLDEMYARGLPRELYLKYLNEAIDTGLIPVAGRSRIDGRLVTKEDILTRDMLLAKIPQDFKSNRYWYGVG